MRVALQGLSMDIGYCIVYVFNKVIKQKQKTTPMLAYVFCVPSHICPRRYVLILLLGFHINFALLT